jgi:hypothetical protein
MWQDKGEESMTKRAAIVLAVALIASISLDAKVKIKTQFDKAFDFKPMKTFAWHPDGAGAVHVLQLSGDDAATLKTQLNPGITSSVEQGLAARGLAPAAAPAADLYVSYTLLLGPGTSAQVAGQFIAPVPEWGIVPFAAQTTSIEVYEQGTLIVDVASRARQKIVFRGSAESAIDRMRTPEARDKLIRDAILDMLKKLPTKK